MDALELNREYNRRVPFVTIADAEQMAVLYRKYHVACVRYGDTFTVTPIAGGFGLLQDVKNDR